MIKNVLFDKTKDPSVRFFIYMSSMCMQLFTSDKPAVIKLYVPYGAFECGGIDGKLGGLTPMNSYARLDCIRGIKTTVIGLAVTRQRQLLRHIEKIQCVFANFVFVQPNTPSNNFYRNLIISPACCTGDNGNKVKVANNSPTGAAFFLRVHDL